jgi:Flp pilus assembly pilin Flp
MTSRLAHAPFAAIDHRPRLDRDARGAVFVEYAVLVAFVGLVLTLMLVTLGPRVVREYSARRATLYSHSP